VNTGDVLKRVGVVAGVAGVAAGAIYAVERALVARLRQQEDPDAGRSFAPDFDEVCDVVTDDGARLRVISRGRGRPIVLIHGVSLSSRVWTKQFESLPSMGCRVIAFDLRGHGDSTVGVSGHSLDVLAEDVRTVLEELDLHDAVVVGHSMGGMAVQAFAIRHPDVVRERVCGIVLLSTSSRMVMSDIGVLRGAAERIVGFAPDVAAFMRQRNLGLLLARVGFGDSPAPSHVEATRQMLSECKRDTIRGAGVGIVTLDLADDLPRVKVPALVVVGTADALTPPRDARAIAGALPDAELVEMPGAGHMLMFERADELDAIIGAFADRC
jgi:pimeloyl-ACP methyl ester carboxylesterase